MASTSLPSRNIFRMRAGAATGAAFRGMVVGFRGKTSSSKRRRDCLFRTISKTAVAATVGARHERTPPVHPFAVSFADAPSNQSKRRGDGLVVERRRLPVAPGLDLGGERAAQSRFVLRSRNADRRP